MISGKGKFTEYYSDGRVWIELEGTAKNGSISGYARIIHQGNPAWYFEGIVENTTGKVIGKEKVRDAFILEGTFVNGTLERGTWTNLKKGTPVSIKKGIWDGRTSNNGFATQKIRFDTCETSCINGYREGEWYVISGLWANGELVRPCQSESDCSPPVNAPSRPAAAQSTYRVTNVERDDRGVEKFFGKCGNGRGFLASRDDVYRSMPYGACAQGFGCASGATVEEAVRKACGE